MIGWLDALRGDDVEALKATLAPDVVWQGLREEWTCHGDHVILHASGGGIVAIEDVALPDGIYNVFTLDAGTISRIDDYADRHEALAAAGLSNATAGE
jgi:hypothetical protein